MKEVLSEILEVGERSFNVPILIYENKAEMNKHATDDVIVDRLNGYLRAHGTNSDARALVVAVVQEMSKVAFVTKDVNKDGKVIKERDETDKKYVARAFATTPSLSFDAVEKEVQRRARGGYPLLDEKGNQVIVDGKPVMVAPIATDLRKAEPSVKKPKTLSQRRKDQALAFITGKPFGEKQVVLRLDKFIAAFGKMFKPETFALDATIPKDDVKNIEALGWALERYDKKRDDDAKAARAAQDAKDFAA